MGASLGREGAPKQAGAYSRMSFQIEHAYQTSSASLWLRAAGSGNGGGLWRALGGALFASRCCAEYWRCDLFCRLCCLGNRDSSLVARAAQRPTYRFPLSYLDSIVVCSLVIGLAAAIVSV